MNTQSAARVLMALGIAWSGAATAQTAPFGRPAATPAPAVGAARPGAAAGEDAHKQFAAALAADPELKQIQKQMQDALLAQGRGQFESTMQQLAQRRASAESAVASRLDIDPSKLRSPATQPRRAGASATGPALKHSITPGLSAAPTAPAVPGGVQTSVWKAEYDTLPQSKGEGSGSCMDLPEPGSQSSNPARASSAVMYKENESHSCWRRRWRYVEVDVPPSNEGVTGPYTMHVTARVRKTALRAADGGVAYIGLLADEGGCGVVSLTSFANSAKSFGEEVNEQGFTVTCEIPLKKGGGSQKVKVGPFAKASNDNAPSGSPWSAMADISVDKLEVQVVYAGPK